MHQLPILAWQTAASPPLTISKWRENVATSYTSTRGMFIPPACDQVAVVQAAPCVIEPVQMLDQQVTAMASYRAHAHQRAIGPHPMHVGPMHHFFEAPSLQAGSGCRAVPDGHAE